mgnify:CR=1 FL=1
MHLSFSVVPWHTAAYRATCRPQSGYRVNTDADTVDAVTTLTSGQHQQQRRTPAVAVLAPVNSPDYLALGVVPTVLSLRTLGWFQQTQRMWPLMVNA